MTLWNLVCTAATGAPDRVIIADDHGRQLTAAQFRDTAERVAAGLPVRSGDNVSWQLPTTIEAPVLMAALARLGVRQNPIIPAFRERELRVVTNQIKPALYITTETWRGHAHADVARSLGSRVLAVDLDDHPGPAVRLPTGDPSTLPPPPSEDTRWVHYSSGTTSAPKGVQHTDASLMASAVGLIELGTFGVDDIYPIAWPMAHMGGITLLTTSLRVGVKLVMFDTWDPVTSPERMAAHQPTILGAALPFFRAYIDAQQRHGNAPLFPALRVITAGGAPTPPEIVRELSETFGIRGVQGCYGLTEFPVATCVTPDDSDDIMIRSVGRPSPAVRVRIVDGEIRLKGPQCFHGYVDASLDAEAFDEGGWFRTGDLGEIDDDNNVFVTGRAKDIIIRNAENISALEIEDALLRHPDIADVIVIGLPDARVGERVCAVIVARGDAHPDVATVADHCIAIGLAKYKCPEQIELVPSLDRNALGKVDKRSLLTTLAGE